MTWTPEKAARARGLLAAATPGPWRLFERGGGVVYAGNLVVARADARNAVLIAEVPHLLADALAEIDTLERYRKHWEESAWKEQQRADAAENRVAALETVDNQPAEPLLERYQAALEAILRVYQHTSEAGFLMAQIAREALGYK